MNSARSSSPHPRSWRTRSEQGSRRSDCRTEGENRAEALGGLLGAVLADLGLDHKLIEYRARQVWDEAVGPALAGQGRPLRVHNGRMEVAVPSAVWRNQLSFMKQDIITRINELAGGEVIKELILLNQ